MARVAEEAGRGERRVHRLTERTEGWAVGIYLATLARDPGEEPIRSAGDISGRDTLIAAYLREELLRQVADEDLVFLARTPDAALAADHRPSLRQGDQRVPSPRRATTRWCRTGCRSRARMCPAASGARRAWRNSVPIAPWLYVLGVARFAMQRVDTFEGKPIETWVYPQDRDAGFADFASPTRDVLAFYSDYVGPFAYERLANIQASSVAGGMESASAILYHQSSVTGTRSVRWRNVVIHEVAHQWFGNAVTERRGSR